MSAAAEQRLVAAQIDRAPRLPWRVATYCPFGRPAVIATPPRLSDDSPFPTLYWLSCPRLVARIGGMESSGAVDEWQRRIADERPLALKVLLADSAYREARRMEGGGEDPCEDVGIAGQRDPLKTKCLHAHAASYLAGIDDPVGKEVVAGAGRWCDNDECEALEKLAALSSDESAVSEASA